MPVLGGLYNPFGTIPAPGARTGATEAEDGGGMTASPGGTKSVIPSMLRGTGMGQGFPRMTNPGGSGFSHFLGNLPGDFSRKIRDYLGSLRGGANPDTPGGLY